jgi:hypothetical protein
MSLEHQISSFKKKLLNQSVIIKKIIEPTQDRDINRKQNPVFYSNNQVPLSRQLFEIIECLKLETKPITNNDIIRKRAIDILDNPKLLEVIIANDRIEFNSEDKTFKYKPIHHIKNKTDLLNLLKKNRGVTAMEVKELKNSCPHINDLINVF